MAFGVNELSGEKLCVPSIKKIYFPVWWYCTLLPLWNIMVGQVDVQECYLLQATVKSLG